MSSYLDTLNAKQREAVETLDGPLLVLAGAGTGKTRVLTTRFAHLITTGRAFPSQILAVTFTNKAASEMRERVSRLTGQSVERLWLGTFHEISARILRRHADLVGLSSGFSILDSTDQLRLLKRLMADKGLDTKRWDPQYVLSLIQRFKDRNLLPQEVPPADVRDLVNGQLINLYDLYQKELLALNAADFGDLLLHVTCIFRAYPEVLQNYQHKFRYILVDEYQDTNVTQYYWLRLLAGGHHNICCVGDDDQSIYAWRGAEITNILRFEKDFPDAKVIRLEENYRSTASVLAAASHLIAHNKSRLGKTLYPGTALQHQGPKVTVCEMWDSEEEARQIIARIANPALRPHPLAETAVLVRTGAQTRAFEEVLLAAGMPYRVIGGQRFYERLEIRDALAYLKLVHADTDNLAFERIVNAPPRGIGAGSLATLRQIAEARQISLFTAAVQADSYKDLRKAAKAGLAALVAAINEARKILAAEGHIRALEVILEQSGYIRVLKENKSPEAAGRLENLKELAKAMADFSGLESFFDHISLFNENDKSAEEEGVRLMTLHAAKGLEFDTVFLPGWEEGLFPSQRTLDERGEEGLEEERRLAYVGMTRARKNLIISHANSRKLYAGWQRSLPGRFLSELPAEHIEVISPRRQSASYSAPASAKHPGESYPSSRSRGSPSFQRSLTAPARGPVLKFYPGERIFHKKFGYGQVLAVETASLKILFEKAGEKSVLTQFVEKA